MAKDIKLIVYPAKDMDKMTKFFNAYLQTEPYHTSAYYTGYKIGDLEVGLEPKGTTVLSYIDVDDMEDSIKILKEAGAEVSMEPKDVGGGLMVAQVQIDGNTLGLRKQPA